MHVWGKNTKKERWEDEQRVDEREKGCRRDKEKKKQQRIGGKITLDGYDQFVRK